MIEFIQGDIFRSAAEALVIPVNCMGVCGAGLAKEFAQRFPREATMYRKLCRHAGIQPGRTYLIPGQSAPGRFVAFPTKLDWRHKSRLVWIEDGLTDMAGLLLPSRFKWVALPALGCGLGGLHWPDVKGLIESRLAKAPAIRFTVCEPPPTADGI